MSAAERAALNLPDRWWAKVRVTDGCWLWIGAIQSKGYGNAWVDGKNELAHRVAYIAANGPIPDGLTIDHICRVHQCVRPSHMELVTTAENTRRGAAAKTECRHGHPYPENAVVYANGERRCRQCSRDRSLGKAGA